MERDKVGTRRSSLAAPKHRRMHVVNRPGKIVGWIDKPRSIAWVVSPHRKDRRTGYINPPQLGPYANELLALAVPWAKLK
jgi:hypothetical protein